MCARCRVALTAVLRALYKATWCRARSAVQRVLHSVQCAAVQRLSYAVQCVAFWHCKLHSSALHCQRSALIALRCTALCTASTRLQCDALRTGIAHRALLQILLHCDALHPALCIAMHAARVAVYSIDILHCIMRCNSHWQCIVRQERCALRCA